MGRRGIVCLLALAPVWAEQPAGKLLRQAWEAQNKGAREECFRVATEALRLAEAAHPRAAGYATDLRGIAQIHQRLGFVVRAEQILARAIERTRAVPEAQILLKADLLQLYAGEQRRMEMLRTGDDLLAEARRLPSRDLGILAGALHQLVAAAEGSGQMARAEGYARLAAELGPANAPPHLLVEFLNRHGRAEEARALLRKAAEAPAADQPGWQRIQARQMEPFQLQREGKLEEAIEVQKQIIGEAGRAEEEGATGQVFWMKQVLASMLVQAGKMGEARRTWQEMMEESERQLPLEAHAQRVLAYASWLAWQAKQPEEAAAAIEPLLGREDLGEHVRLQMAGVMGGIEQQRGNADKAREWRERGAEIQSRLAETQRYPGGSMQGELHKLNVATSAGRWDEAAHHAQRLIEIGPTARDGEGFAQAVASAAMAMRGRAPGQAAELMARLLAAAESISGWWASPLQQALERQTQMSMQSRDWEQARRWLKRWLSYVEQTRGASSQAMMQVVQTKISLEQGMGNHAAALAEAESWLKQVEANSGAESREVLGGMLQAARLCRAGGDAERGADYVVKAVAMIDRVNAAREASRVYLRGEAADALAQLGDYDGAMALAGQAQELAADLAPQYTRSGEQIERFKRMRAKKE